MPFRSLLQSAIRNPYSAILFIAGCGLFEKEKPLERFYFPIDRLEKGLVYAYQPVGVDSAAVEFWYLRSEKRGGRRWLVSQFYRPDFSVGQLVEEEIFENGAVARRVSLFQTDSVSGKSIEQPTRILEGNLFSFEKMDTTENLRFSLDWRPLGDTSSTVFLKRVRRFAGAGQPFFFKNGERPTVRFSLREVVGNSGEGAAEVKGRGEEIYAEGLGLLSYKKEFDGGLKLAFRLVDTFSMEELQRRARAGGFLSEL